MINTHILMGGDDDPDKDKKVFFRKFVLKP
jgi:hypothetical protein